MNAAHGTVRVMTRIDRALEAAYQSTERVMGAIVDARAAGIALPEELLEAHDAHIRDMGAYFDAVRVDRRRKNQWTAHDEMLYAEIRATYGIGAPRDAA